MDFVTFRYSFAVFEKNNTIFWSSSKDLAHNGISGSFAQG